MAYNIKDVFYLSTSATITASQLGAGTAQLDLSAYIDPIARGKQKGTGLAIYKVHFDICQSSSSEPIDDAETGVVKAGLVAGLGVGDNATNALQLQDTIFRNTNSLLVSTFEFYGPKSMIVNASTTPTMYNTLLIPSTEVPYVVVRDNACLCYDVGAVMATEHIISVRLDCAQITLDQATLNQLLRTQTV